MCKYCDYNSDENNIFQDGLTGEFYLKLETDAYALDEYDDGYVYIREYISYCPYCGRKLNGN